MKAIITQHVERAGRGEFITDTRVYLADQLQPLFTVELGFSRTNWTYSCYSSLFAVIDRLALDDTIDQLDISCNFTPFVREIASGDTRGQLGQILAEKLEAAGMTITNVKQL
ncbi:MAG TPA: hypothetical protein VFK33_10865 [Bacillales bacterium]|nr:hypothetical protein [Bacillales bacterium]